MCLRNKFFFGWGLLTALVTLAAVKPAGAEPIPAACKVGDFFVGCQAYTFNRFSVMEAIEKTAQAGGTVIEFYPGQKFSPEQPTVKWDHHASDENVKLVQDQLAKYHVRAVGYGVVSPGGGEAEWRKVFEFAKKMDLYSITTESVNDLDTIEKLVKEFDIKIGIHEHKRRVNNANYKVWDPNYVLSVVKDRDPRIGACADTGHWATSGLVPLDCIKILKGRIVSVHLKERKEIGKELPDTIYGTGASNIKGILDELKSQGFAGQIAIEYENNWDHSVPDVAQCIGFVRGYSAAGK
jgi:sugar phosphate isomerase/epimerase